MRIRWVLFGKEDSDYADSLNNLASIYQLYDLKKALELYEMAYLISIKICGVSHNVSLIFLNNLAETQRKLGNLNECLKLNKKCLQFKEDLQQNNISLGKTLNNISLAYYALKKPA